MRDIRVKHIDRMIIMESALVYLRSFIYLPGDLSIFGATMVILRDSTH